MLPAFSRRPFLLSVLSGLLWPAPDKFQGQGALSIPDASALCQGEWPLVQDQGAFLSTVHSQKLAFPKIHKGGLFP